ncbi:hypothetical protein [Rothia kristinae]|uniref:hypothetical protein n=1 Tax=Rothia kristinae TaxID=37923 RepID=UPI00119D926C|nr:hypothetical protein [Rothia kristinae]
MSYRNRMNSAISSMTSTTAKTASNYFLTTPVDEMTPGALRSSLIESMATSGIKSQLRGVPTRTPMPKLNNSNYVSTPTMEIAKESPGLFTGEILKHGGIRRLPSGEFDYSMAGTVNGQPGIYRVRTVPKPGEQEIVKQFVTPQDGEFN